MARSPGEEAPWGEAVEDIAVATPARMPSVEEEVGELHRQKQALASASRGSVFVLQQHQI